MGTIRMVKTTQLVNHSQMQIAGECDLAIVALHMVRKEGKQPSKALLTPF